MRLSIVFSLMLAGLTVIPALAHATDEAVLEEVVVTAALRPQSLVQVPESVTVLDSQTLKDAGQQHFEDVLGLVPNLNWAAGSSRPRYFQLRGIGETEQYTGAPNPSVGFLIDDIDFSGLGMPATLFDVRQIEVLRGPQGTRYGANALAGLIAIRSNDPGEEPYYSVENTVGNYNTLSTGAVATAPVESMHSAWRLSIQKYHSDGFMDNSYLDRKDTNGRDELSGRFKWHSELSDHATLDFTLLHANLDNGYDAWAINNSRTSLSDKPGKDTQRSTGASLKFNNRWSNDLLLTVTGSAASSDYLQSYDGDWGNTQSWQSLMHAWAVANGVSGNAWQEFVYDYVDHADHQRDTRSLDVRLASDNAGNAINWLIGAYALNLREHIREVSQGDYRNPYDAGYDSSINDTMESRYDATNVALYAQLDGRFASRWNWSAGLRSERRSADYKDNRSHSDFLDSANDYSARMDTSHAEKMWGGQASIGFDVSEAQNMYLAVSRGYKAGGFNLGFAAQAKPNFSQESVLSYEFGTKGTALQGRLYFDAALFYEKRNNMQVLNSRQLVAGDPNSFQIFTDNAGSGFNTGLESSVRFRVTSAYEMGGSLGLLRARTRTYSQDDGTLIESREQAHAPGYTAGVYGLWRMPGGLMTRVDVQAKDHFYFSAAPYTHESKAYSITNIKVGYERTGWDAYLWVSNLFDKNYSVRGFEFGNEPPEFNESLYLQKGDPRQIGVTGSWKF